MPDRPLRPLEARERLATRVWGIAFCILYWLTRTSAHSLDALSYARAVRDGGTASLFHPHHLLYNPVIRGLWEALNVVHPRMDPLNVAAFLNCMLAGLALALFARFLLENGATYFWTSIATFGLGLSQCMWTLASENEVYAGTLLLLVLAARECLRSARSSRGEGAIRTGLFIGGAALLHVVSLLFLAPACLLATQGIPGRGARIRATIGVVLAALLPLAAFYGAAAIALNASSGPAMAAWANKYMRWQSWIDRDPSRLALGFLWFLRGAVPDFGLIGRAPAPTASALLNDIAQVPFILFTAAVVYLAIDCVRKWPYLEWRFGSLPRLGLWWFLCFELFLGWVGRSSLKFWILTLPPLWTFVAMWGDLRFGDPEGEGLRKMSRRALLGTFIALTCLVATTGFLVVAPRHDPRRDRPLHWNDAIVRATQPGDLILVPEGDLEGYLLYFGRRDNLLTLESLARYTRSLDASLDTLEARATRARAAGHRAWMTGTGLVATPEAARLWGQAHDPRAAWTRLLPRLGPPVAYDRDPPATREDGELGHPVLLELLPDSASTSADTVALRNGR